MSFAIRMSIISLNLYLGVIKCACGYVCTCVCTHTLGQPVKCISCIEVKKVEVKKAVKCVSCTEVKKVRQSLS